MLCYIARLFEASFDSKLVKKYSLSALKKLRREYLVAWKKETELFKPRIVPDAVKQ